MGKRSKKKQELLWGGVEDHKEIEMPIRKAKTLKNDDNLFSEVDFSDEDYLGLTNRKKRCGMRAKIAIISMLCLLASGAVSASILIAISRSKSFTQDPKPTPNNFTGGFNRSSSPGVFKNNGGNCCYFCCRGIELDWVRVSLLPNLIQRPLH